jgi:hypothetical protein
MSTRAATRDRQDRSGPNFVHTRDRSGNVVITERETGQVVDGDAPSGDQPAPPVAQEKVKVGRYEIDETSLGQILERQAADDLKKATLPPTPQDYKLEISPDAKLPGDAKFQFDANDPALRDAAAWAHSKGLDQGSFSEMLTLYASHVAQQNAVLQDRARAEIAKAGPNAGARVDAISKFITAEMGEADARPIRATIVTDAHLRFYERMINKITSQGTAPFSQQHRDRPEEGKVSEEQWAGMSDAAKLDYARSFNATERRYQLPQHR